MTSNYPIVVLISGRGSLLPALITGQGQYHIAAIISNRPFAPGLAIAKDHQIPSIICDHLEFKDQHGFDQQLQTIIDELSPKLIVLAGFMRCLGPAICRHFAGKIINIHPALLPKFPGLNTYQRALDAQEQQHGSSVHIVNAQLDAGPLITQIAFPIDPSDDVERLKDKTQAIEAKLYPYIIKQFATGQLCWRGGQLRYQQQIVDKLGIRISHEELMAP